MRRCELNLVFLLFNPISRCHGPCQEEDDEESEEESDDAEDEDEEEEVMRHVFDAASIRFLNYLCFCRVRRLRSSLSPLNERHLTRITSRASQ